MIKRIRIAAIVAVMICTMASFAWAAGQSGGSTAADEIPEIELMMGGWVNQPTDENDPFRAFLNETFGVDITMNNTAEFNNEILTRFATGDPPDIVHFTGTTGEAYLRQLYDEGFLVEDWNQYKSQVPGWFRNMDDNAEQYFTVDEKLIALTTAGPPNIWGWQIRKDWLATLGMDIPTTPDELLDVARAFTRNDPDNNGKDDTWAFTSSGSGKGIGEIGNYKLMWGPMDFYIADGEVSHPVIDGTEKAFLDFMRTVVNEGLVEPNWYTVSWQERKAVLFQSRLGTAWYPGVLISEFVNEGNVTVEEAVELWAHFPVPKGSAQGGKLMSPAFFDRMNTVSSKSEEDTAKFGKILALMEGVSYPSDGYFSLRFGVGIDKGKKHELPGGYTAILAGPGADRYRSSENFLGAADWGKWHSSRADFSIFTPATSPDGIPATVFGEIELNSGALAEPTYTPDARFIHLDKTVIGELDTVVAEFEYKYIVGDTDDYESFKNRWLNAGGQELLDDAKAQFKQVGLIK
jgi:putative aldouronate transport system substrate-binding protein